MRLSRPLLLIYVAGFLRSLGVGLLGVILGVYLSRVGVSSTRIGLVIGAGLLGACAATAVMVWAGARVGYRTSLVTLSLLAAVGGVALVALPSFPILLLLVFIGMVNGMGADRSAAFAMEQAIIPGLVADRSRTWALSWYNVLLDGGGAVGALGAVLPLVVSIELRVELVAAYRYIFAGYAVLHAAVAALYLLLPAQNELLHPQQIATQKPVVSPQSKRTIHHIAALFAMDAFGGGFLTDALVSYWFFRRFGIAEQKLALLFFAVHILNALSHLGAAWLAQRIGLLNAMVFTHIPSSLFLLGVPLASGPKLAVVLFLLRESLVEMDVPTRQSYVAAVVQPHERPYASGVTNVTRTGSWAVASAVSGLIMQRLAFSAPLIIAGVLKISYDLLLYRNFRHLKPPEEQVANSPKIPATTA